MDPLRESDPVTIGDFALLGRVGQGGMGRVYLAESRAGQRVALKVMLALSDDPMRRERFTREVEILRSAVGVSIANYTADGITDDTPWLATEYVAGPTLDRPIFDHGPLDTRLSAMLGASLAEGLGHIHRAGLLHRDFKPHNVILGRHGPKIIDFGLAIDAQSPSHFTATGMVAGTAAWMAPEQAAGQRDLTPAADIYALAAVLVFTATGKVPNPRGRPSVAGLNPNLAAVISAMLADEPADRPDATDVREALLSTVGDDIAAALQDLVSATYGRYEPVNPPPPPKPKPQSPTTSDPTVLVATPVRRQPSPERAAAAAGNLRTAYAATREL